MILVLSNVVSHISETAWVHNVNLTIYCQYFGHQLDWGSLNSVYCKYMEILTLDCGKCWGSKLHINGAFWRFSFTYVISRVEWVRGEKGSRDTTFALICSPYFGNYDLNLTAPSDASQSFLFELDFVDGEGEIVRVTDSVIGFIYSLIHLFLSLIHISEPTRPY